MFRQIYCCDTGLFVTLAFWDGESVENKIYEKLLSDKLATDLGYVYENAVAQILVSAGNKLFYHTWPTKEGSRNYEIDFLLSRQSKICPVEVKSSQSKVHHSIDVFKQKYSSRILKSYMLYTKDMRKEKDLICLPLYMSMMI